jgi:hypothetical protein
MALSCSFKNNETGQKLTKPAPSKISILQYHQGVKQIYLTHTMKELQRASRHTVILSYDKYTIIFKVGQLNCTKPVLKGQ